MFHPPSSLCTGTKDYCHLERLYLLLLCGIINKIIRSSLCEFKRDLLYFLDICNNIILQHINVNPMKRCLFMHFNYDLLH